MDRNICLQVHAHQDSVRTFKDTFAIGMSDFSIEYILNRAGDRYCGTNSCAMRSDNGNYDESLSDERSFHHAPMFDWLQYTRYRPPKLPRPLRQGPVKRTPGRLPRVPFTPSQLSALENAYRMSTYLSSEDANKLALQLDLTNTRVKIWFQNRRARERREKREKGECPDLSMSISPSSSPDRAQEFISID